MSTTVGDSNQEGTTRTRYHLDNLCCESEAALIHKRLDHLPGVHDIKINIVARQVTVVHDPQLASSDDIADALDGAGLGARPAACAAATAGAERETRQLPVTLTASAALFFVSLGAYWLPQLEWAALAAIAVGIWPIGRKAVIALRNRVLDMNVLMTIAIAGAVVIGEWHEGAAAVVLLALSEWLEDRSLDRARAAIAAVSAVAPATAVLADGDREVPVADVPVGTLVAVKPGRRIPLDGIVTAGASAVDESALTGESVPVAKAVGNGVAAGTVNGSGFLEVRTTAVAGDSAVARMARLVEEAQTARSPTERFVDRFAAVYTPIVVAGAAIVFAVPTLAGGDPGTWFYRALVLLVVACPCALVISTPVTVVSGLARAARGGVLIKGGTHLETLGRLRALAFDKTGTLTEGRFRVVDCRTINGAVASDELHRLMAAMESRSGHPVAEALAAHATDPAAAASKTVAYETLDGEGVAARVDGRQVHGGNHRLAMRLGWHDDAEHAIYTDWSDDGKTVVFHGVDGGLEALHSLADLPRPEAAEAVAALHDRGLAVVMLTGDNAGSAEAVGRRLDLDDVRAELQPGDKVTAVQALRVEYGTVGMVGDGVNDAPALAAADVGIAMGVRGTAVAMETADVALMTDDLRRLADVVGLGRRALRTIKINVAFALAVKAIVIALALTGQATLWMAVAADVGTSLIVVLHGMTVLRYDMS
jgi:Cd2+/Zn2+-exporting ATPase